MKKKQTCLIPKYDKDGQQIGYDIKLPKIITDDLGFEMQFGFPSPSKPSPTSGGIKEQKLKDNNGNDILYW